MSLAKILRSPVDFSLGIINAFITANFDVNPATQRISTALTNYVKEDYRFTYAYGAGCITLFTAELVAMVGIPIISTTLAIKHNNKSPLLIIPSYFLQKVLTRYIGRSVTNIYTQPSKKCPGNLESLLNIIDQNN